MRVLHVIPFPGIGGTEIATRRIADAVRPFGVESTVMLLAPTEDQLDYFGQAGVACLAEHARPEPSLLRDAPRFLRESRRLADLCAEFDLVHCADVLAAYHMAVAARMARRPVICHVRNRIEKIPLRSRIFIGAANHFTFVSKHTRDHFPMPIARRRTSILYDGVDTSRDSSPEARQAAGAEVRAELGLPADTILAAMFARVNPQKDYETLIRAAAILRDSHPALRFLVVGDKDRVALNRRHFAEVEVALRAAGVADRFVFTGFREDMHRLMLAADISVLCTHFEGLPLVLIEAMAAGCPCVATAVDGIPELFTEPSTGLLHTHQDAEGLATAIARLADDRDMAREMGANARRVAERRFSETRFARDAHALYTAISGAAATRGELRTAAVRI